MFSVGNVTLPPLFLAPMAGISDLAFRLINRSLGCGFAFTEMISAHSLVYRNKTTLKMLSSSPNDRPLGVQIVGSDPEIIKRSLDILLERAFDSIDLNAACPVNKVISKGEGAGLLREPLKLQKLLSVIVRNAGVPVTVKIRSGWDETSVNAMEVALRAQDAGVSGIILHGRTREQGYSGNVDYNIIRKVKESVQIPLMASGDALTPDLIRKLFTETGCNAVAVARGALGNPWIFNATSEYLKSGRIPLKPSVYEKAQTMKDHLDLLVAFRGEMTGVILFRKLFVWYSRGMAAKRLRIRAFQAVSRDEMMQLISELEGLSATEAAEDARFISGNKRPENHAPGASTQDAEPPFIQ